MQSEPIEGGSHRAGDSAPPYGAPSIGCGILAAGLLAWRRRATAPVA